MEYRITENGYLKKLLIGSLLKTECGGRFFYITKNNPALYHNQICNCGKIIVVKNKKKYMKKIMRRNKI